MSNSESHFTIENIQSLTQKPHMYKVQIYNKVYEQIQHYIKSRALQGMSEIIYEIPQFILGQPPFNVRDCAIYIHRVLTDKKFDVEIFSKENTQYYLKVSWKKKVSQPTTQTTTKQNSKNTNHDLKTLQYYNKGYLDNYPINPKASKSLYL
jgi:hypothetical protein